MLFRDAMLERVRVWLLPALERLWTNLTSVYPDKAALAEMVRRKTAEMLPGLVDEVFGDRGSMELRLTVPGCIRQVANEFVEQKLRGESPQVRTSEEDGGRRRQQPK